MKALVLILALCAPVFAQSTPPPVADPAPLNTDATAPSPSAPESPEESANPAASPDNELVQEPLTPAEPAMPAPKALDPEAPEDQVETIIHDSADHYEAGERAQCGGDLLIAAELIEKIAAPRQSEIQAEVETLRQQALEAARGKLKPENVDLATARAYIRLAKICQDKCDAAWKKSEPKAAGQQWYRAALFLDRSVAWGGFGLSTVGDETLAKSQELAEALSAGQPADADEVRDFTGKTSKMIHEVGRALAAKADAAWETEPRHPASSKPRSENLASQENPVVKRVRHGATKLSDFLKRLGQPHP